MRGYKSFEELEEFLLADLSNIKPKVEFEKSSYDTYGFFVGKCIGIEDKYGIVAYYDGFITTEEVLEIGKNYIVDNYYESGVIEVTDDELIELRKYFDSYRELDFKITLQENIKSAIDRQKQKEKEDEEYEKELEEREKNRIKRIEERTEFYDMGVFEGDWFVINGDTLELDYSNSEKKTILKGCAFTECFTLQELGYRDFKYDYPTMLIGRGIGFTIKLKTHNVDVDVGDRIKINGVKVKKAKFKKILEYCCLKDRTKEEIEAVDKLTDLRRMFLDMDNIKIKNDGNYYDLPFSVEMVDVDNYNVDIYGNKGTLNWDIISDIFFYGKHSRYKKNELSGGDGIRLFEAIGLTKLDYFSVVKKLKMLKELENGNAD